jgi:hypothetical protein
MNNKPLSDAQKEKITGEVKEVVNTFNKACEEANADMLLSIFLDSPDFVAQFNGLTFNYKECTDGIRSGFTTITDQKGTILDEKYAVLDNSTVLYSQKSKWLTNLKDGSSVLGDPWAVQLIFKKTGDGWKVLSSSESGSQKIIKASDIPKELNQVELHKQFIGYWKAEMGKDTITFWDVKSYGTGIEGYFKVVTKGKIFMDGKQLWGYDKKLDKYVMSEMVKGMDNALYSSWFISKDKCVMLSYNDISNPDNASMKYEVEFKSPDILVQTTIVNNKTVKIDTMTRVK